MKQLIFSQQWFLGLVSLCVLLACGAGSASSGTGLAEDAGTNTETGVGVDGGGVVGPPRVRFVNALGYPSFHFDICIFPENGPAPTKPIYQALGATGPEVSGLPDGTFGRYVDLDQSTRRYRAMLVGPRAKDCSAASGYNIRYGDYTQPPSTVDFELAPGESATLQLHQYAHSFVLVAKADDLSVTPGATRLRVEGFVAAKVTVEMDADGTQREPLKLFGTTGKVYEVPLGKTGRIYYREGTGNEHYVTIPPASKAEALTLFISAIDSEPEPNGNSELYGSLCHDAEVTGYYTRCDKLTR